MHEFVYAIPSYKRAERQLTVNYLGKAGVKKQQIKVFVQTKEDEEAYAKTIGSEAEIIYKKAERCVEARNNILNELIDKTNVVMLDDDISALGIMNDEKIQKIESGETLNELFQKMFEFCKKGKVFIFGVYPVYNAFFMSQTISTKAPINTVFGFTKGFKGRFDESYDTKEDAAFCAKILSIGRSILRFNFMAVDADHRKTKSGYIDEWHQEENIRCVKHLVSEFPNIYAIQKNKPWEVRTIIKDQKRSVKNGNRT